VSVWKALSHVCNFFSVSKYLIFQFDVFWVVTPWSVAAFILTLKMETATTTLRGVTSQKTLSTIFPAMKISSLSLIFV
jgi:hypothetical protein